MKKKTEQKARKRALRLLLMVISLCLLLPVGLTACSSDDDDNTSGCYTAEVLDPYVNSSTMSSHIVCFKEIPQKDVSKGKLKKNTVVKIIEERPVLYKIGELISFKVINFKEFHGNQYLLYNIEYECVVEPCE